MGHLAFQARMLRILKMKSKHPVIKRVYGLDFAFLEFIKEHHLEDAVDEGKRPIPVHLEIFLDSGGLK